MLKLELFHRALSVSLDAQLKKPQYIPKDYGGKNNV